ncbi:MAG: cbb3-type cytochrome c oxidase N-terminal domain-containing protein [Chitinophagales bacterium]
MINRKTSLLTVVISLTPILLQAQEEAAKPSFLSNHFNTIAWGLVVTALIILFWTFFHLLKGMLYLLAKETLGEEAAAKYTLLPEINFKWKKINTVLTDAVPIEYEHDILLDHDYDGIKELDNHLPPWWKWMFYATIVYAVVYIGYFYVWGLGADQYEKYDKKVALAEIQKAEYLANMANNVDENTVTFLADASSLSSGQSIFKANCVTCHGQVGEGTPIAPNLTDQYWIHGGDIKDIFKTIKYGVQNKGMISWQDQLLPNEMSEVASYIVSLQGSNPENAREPQGELYEPEADVAESTESAE